MPGRGLSLFLIGFILAAHLSIFARELITDPHFQRGLKVLNPTSGQAEGRLQWSSAGGAPIWACAQWHSHSSLAGLTPDTLASGWLQWANEDKTIRLGPIAGENYDIYMGVNSDHEFGGIYRTSGQPWPALLVQQRLSPPNTFGPGCPPLSELASLNFHVEVRLDTARIIKKYGYNPGLHAAHFPIYFVVQNLRRSSPGYGKMIWLGLHVYDDRWALPPKYVAHDQGTNTLIYSIAYETMSDSSVQSGDWVSLDVDLLPHAINALHEAWRLGYLQASQDLADYKIGAMNLGWEVPGLAFVGMEVRNLSLLAISGTGVEKDPMAPENYDLRAFPNPFAKSTRIILRPGAHGGHLRIINLVGQVVREWHVASRPGETLTLRWNGLDGHGDELPSGIYFLNYADSKVRIIRRILLLR